MFIRVAATLLGIFTVILSPFWSIPIQADAPDKLIQAHPRKIYLGYEFLCTYFLVHRDPELDPEEYGRAYTAGHCWSNYITLQITRFVYYKPYGGIAVSLGVGADMAAIPVSEYISEEIPKHAVETDLSKTSYTVFVDGYGNDDGTRFQFLCKAERMLVIRSFILFCNQRVHGGMSGSPVLDIETGHVIGILTHRNMLSPRIGYATDIRGVRIDLKRRHLDGQNRSFGE